MKSQILEPCGGNEDVEHHKHTEKHLHAQKHEGDGIDNHINAQYICLKSDIIGMENNYGYGEE